MTITMLIELVRWEKRVLLGEIPIKMRVSRNDTEMKENFDRAVQEMSRSKFRIPFDFNLERGLFGFFDGSDIMILARPNVKFGLDLLQFSSAYRFHGKIVVENSSDKYLVGEIRLISLIRGSLILFVNIMFLFLIFGIPFGMYELIVLKNVNALFVLPLFVVVSILNLCGVYLMCKLYAFLSRRARKQIYESLIAITGSDVSTTSFPKY